MLDGAGGVLTPVLRTYRLPQMADIPDTEVYFADTSDDLGPYGAKSMSESPSTRSPRPWPTRSVAPSASAPAKPRCPATVSGTWPAYPCATSQHPNHVVGSRIPNPEVTARRHQSASYTRMTVGPPAASIGSKSSSWVTTAIPFAWATAAIHRSLTLARRLYSASLTRSSAQHLVTSAVMGRGSAVLAKSSVPRRRARGGVLRGQHSRVQFADGDHADCRRGPRSGYSLVYQSRRCTRSTGRSAETVSRGWRSIRPRSG